MNGTNELLSYVISCNIYRNIHSSIYDEHEVILLLPLTGQLSSDSYDKFELAQTYMIYSQTSIQLQCQNTCIYFELRLRPELFIDYLNTTYFFQRAIWKLSENQATALMPIFFDLLLHYEFAEHNELLAASDLLKLLHILTAAYGAPNQQEPDSATNISNDLWPSLSEYLSSCYACDISQSETAGYFHITPQYLARVMKKHTGMTFKQYLFYLRQKRKEEYQTYTSLNHREIELKLNGRFSIAHKASKPKNKAQALDYQDIMKHSFFTQHAAAHSSHPITKKTLKAPVLSIEKITDKYISSNWKRLINLGYAKQLRNLKIEDQIIELQSDIGYSYGRICRITDLISQYSVYDQIIYDYTAIFRILDILINNHLYPFLELGNKHFEIQQSTNSSIGDTDSEDSIEYYEYLLRVLPQFLRTSINRYGQDIFDCWCFEFSYLYTDYNSKQFAFSRFIQYFRKIYVMIRSFSSKCRIGGPGFNDWSNPDYISKMLDAFSAYHIVPDFFTAYAYPLLSNSDGSMTVSSDCNIILQRIEEYLKIVRRKYPEKEIWITEFNSNLSSRNYLNDSVYQSTFLANILTKSLQYNIHALGYFLLSDTPLRYADTFDLLFGGLGLFSDNNLPKCAYYTYRFFSKLGNYLVKQSDHYMITANSLDDTQILLYHHVPLRKEYCSRNITKEEVENPADLIAAESANPFCFQLNYLKPGTYLVKVYTISVTLGNILSEWKNSGYFNPNSAESLHDLKLLATPKPQISLVTVTLDKPFELNARIESLEMKFIQIEHYLSIIKPVQ